MNIFLSPNVSNSSEIIQGSLVRPISVHFRGPWPIQGPQEGSEAIFWPNLLSVCVSGIYNTRPNFHSFHYIQAYKPFAGHVPPNSKQYQLILTKYQPVSSYTDPVPSSTTFNYHLMSHAQYTWSSSNSVVCVFLFEVKLQEKSFPTHELHKIPWCMR